MPDTPVLFLQSRFRRGTNVSTELRLSNWPQEAESTVCSQAWEGSLCFTSRQQSSTRSGPRLHALMPEEPHFPDSQFCGSISAQGSRPRPFHTCAVTDLVLCPGTHPIPAYCSSPTWAQRSVFQSRGGPNSPCARVLGNWLCQMPETKPYIPVTETEPRLAVSAGSPHW